MVEGPEGFQLEERPYAVNDWEIKNIIGQAHSYLYVGIERLICGEASALLALWKGSATLPFMIDGVYL